MERLLPGVFRLTGCPETPAQLLRAALLWAGQDGAASHAAAAALWRMRGFSLSSPEIVATRNPTRLPSWVVVHRAGAPIRGVQVVAGFPATPAWRTLLDLGCVAKAEAVERALDDALHRRLASLPQLRWALGAPGSPRHEGSRVLRHLLDARGPGYVPPESDLEGRLFAVLKAGGLPPGVRQYEVWDGRRWRRFDLAWPDHGLGIEVDGWESHGTRSSFQDDRARDRALQLRGWRVLRYTWDEVTAESEAMVEEIRRALLQTVS